LDKTRVYSPIDGTVLSRKVEIGQAVNAGMQTPVLFIIAEDLSKMVLSTQVDEADIGAVGPGQSAVFTVDAYPDRHFKSEVAEVRNVAVVNQSVVSYETRLDVENPDLLLKPGMTATADITTKAYRDVLLAPNAALRFSPPDLQTTRRFGPPIPFLGGGRRGPPGDKSQNQEQEKGKQNANQGVVWTLRGGSPVPLKVRIVATDGTLTAIEGEEVAEGLEILVDVDSATKDDK
jgi:HlyD family secretion protein